MSMQMRQCNAGKNPWMHNLINTLNRSHEMGQAFNFAYVKAAALL